MPRMAWLRLSTIRDIDLWWACNSIPSACSRSTKGTGAYGRLSAPPFIRRPPRGLKKEKPGEPSQYERLKKRELVERSKKTELDERIKKTEPDEWSKKTVTYSWLSDSGRAKSSSETRSALTPYSASTIAATDIRIAATK